MAGVRRARWLLTSQASKFTIGTLRDIADVHLSMPKVRDDNGNVHRAAANILQEKKAARPAAPCATYCYVDIGQV